MKVNTEELKSALEKVKPGLANKENIEQATSFAFIDNRVVTFNDEISISTPVKDLNITGAIEAEQFYKLISKIPKKEINIEEKENEILISAGRTKAGITIYSEITLPIDSINKKSKYEELPEEFIHYLRLNVGSCGKDLSKPILNNIAIYTNGVMISSDGYKIMRSEIGETISTKDFLLPAKSALEVINLNPKYIAESEGWIHFKTDDNTEISCRLFADEYPDITPYTNIEGPKIILPGIISSILDRIYVFAKRTTVLSENVNIKIEKNKIYLKSKDDYGWIEEKASIDYNDEPVNFSILPYLLRDILKETNEFILGENGLKFEGTGWIYITSLNS